MNRLLVCLFVGALLCLVGWTVHAELTRTTPAPQTWEYSILNVNPSFGVARLNEAGTKGWELVTAVCPNGTTSPCLYYLKRPR